MAANGTALGVAVVADSPRFLAPLVRRCAVVVTGLSGQLCPLSCLSFVLALGVVAQVGLALEDDHRNSRKSQKCQGL